MPTIAIFYGIVIQMFFDDHNPPHFHVGYGRSRAMIRISDGKILSGELPPPRRGSFGNGGWRDGANWRKIGGAA